MLFNTLAFFRFFAVVFVLYHLLSRRRQNLMLLAASYVFYASWDPRFLVLLWASTILDYLVGKRIHAEKSQARRRGYLFASVAGNLSMLGFFKYYNFFAEGARSLLSLFGLSINPFTLNVLLPVGISFYTFQSMSYTLDIYRGKLKPAKSPVDFALFVAFFPQLVAGPIERAKNLLPQIEKRGRVRAENIYEGFYLIFWGLFLKVFVADNLARIVDPVFASPDASGAHVLIAVYAFSFQIFADFAGYSSIARGLAKALGFDIMVNFSLPYFARNPREFWRRWHISLSTWLRDYLYIPLGGRNRRVVAVVATMLLGGLWHGAAWTFVLWGAYHAVLVLVYGGLRIPDRMRCLQALAFYHLTCIGWLIFRSESAAKAAELLSRIVFSFNWDGAANAMAGDLLFFAGPVLLVQLIQARRGDLLAVYRMGWAVKGLVYALMFYLITIWGVAGGQEFIYFRF